MARFSCASCGFEKQVPAGLAGRKAKCPKCGRVGVVGPEPAAAPLPAAGERGIFSCPGCGYRKEVPAGLAGKKAKCPKCGRAAEIVSSLKDYVEPSEDDIRLDDLAGEARDRELAVSGLSADDLREDIASGGEAKDEAIGFFQGGVLGNLFAGTVSGLQSVFFCLAYAALVFSPCRLSGHYSQAAGMALASAGIIGVFFALRSRFPFAVAGPETTVCAVLFMFVGSLCAGLSSAPPEVLYPTAVAGVTLTAVLTGLGAYLLGKLKAGTFLRFVPMEIVGGVLAGLGWYLIRGAWVFMTGRQLSLAGLWDSYAAGGFQGLFSQAELSAFLPGLFLGLLLLAVFCRFKNSAALLGVILGFVGLDAAARHLDIPLLSGLLRGHCLPGDVRLDRVLDVFSSDFFGLIHWPALAEHEILMACMVVLVVVTAMSTVTHLEAALGREVDMDGELKALGADNVLAGLCGGMPGSVSLGRSLGNLSCGGRGAASGVLAGILCLAALFFASPLLGFVPKFVPAGLLIYFGLGLLYNWLVASRRELNRRDDYFMLVLAFLATVFFGLVMGVGLGVGLAFMVTLSRYTKAGVVKNRLSGAKHRSNVDRAPSQVEVLRQKGDNIYIVRLQGFIFPGSLHALLKEIRDRAKAIDRLPLRFLVLDFLFVRGLGSAMNISFIKLRHLCERFDIQVVFTSAPLELEDMLVNSGYVLNREGGRFQLFMDLDYGMEWCENRLLEEAGVLKVQEIGLARLLEPVFPDAASIPAFVRCLQKVEVKKRQYVFRQGDLSDVMYFIEKGFLNVELELDGGKVLRLKKMGPGAVFGEMGFYTKTPRSASVVAGEACVIYRLTRERLEAIQARSPKLVSAFNRFLVNLLAARVAEANVKVRDLLG